MSAAVVITRTEHSPAQLRALAARSDDAAQARRLLAIAMIQAGTSRLDAARQTGMDRQTLRDWVHRYNEIDVAGLVSRKPPGATAKLTAVQMAELREWVLAGPDPKIHKVIRWRCVDLRRESGQVFCGDRARPHAQSMAAQDEVHSASATALSSEEGCGGRGGF